MAISAEKIKELIRKKFPQADIEIIDSPKTRYLRSIEKQLVGEYNCNKESEVVLLKRIDNRELYEINCIREIKRMIFDCSPNGCEVLQ